MNQPSWAPVCVAINFGHHIFIRSRVGSNLDWMGPGGPTFGFFIDAAPFLIGHRIQWALELSKRGVIEPKHLQDWDFYSLRTWIIHIAQEHGYQHKELPVRQCLIQKIKFSIVFTPLQQQEWFTFIQLKNEPLVLKADASEHALGVALQDTLVIAKELK